MAPQVVLHLEAAAYERAVADLTELLNRLAQLSQATKGLVQLVERAGDLANVVAPELDRRTARRTGEATLTFKPSKRLLGLVSALRAGERRLPVILDGHGARLKPARRKAATGRTRSKRRPR